MSEQSQVASMREVHAELERLMDDSKIEYSDDDLELCRIWFNLGHRFGATWKPAKPEYDLIEESFLNDTTDGAWPLPHGCVPASARLEQLKSPIAPDVANEIISRPHSKESYKGDVAKEIAEKVLILLDLKADGDDFNSVTWLVRRILAANADPGQGDSPTWPYVLAFAKRMEVKLAMYRHKGDRPGWLKCDFWRLFKRIKEETTELECEIVEKNSGQKVWDEAADVANFAMMTADSYEAYEQFSLGGPDD